jgi:hypothetical protein
VTPVTPLPGPGPGFPGGADDEQPSAPSSSKNHLRVVIIVS